MTGAPIDGAIEPLPPGTVTERIFVSQDEVTRLAVAAAKRASGLSLPTRRTEVVWVDGESELAVAIGKLRVETGRGFVVIALPVRCDQIGTAEVYVTFAAGEPGRPTGMYVSTVRRPRGPELVVDTWGGAIVAFTWKVLLELVSDVAGDAGRDTRGSRLVPGELEATPDGLGIVAMGRHRFAGSRGRVKKA